MGVHEQAWSGMNILVFGKTSQLPMKIEQSIAAASPSNEVRIDSFEDYEDAYDFCKNKKNIGFIILLENCGSLPTQDVFTQLSALYQSEGWPAFGVLVHEGHESFNGLRTLRKNSHLIDYRSSEEFLNPTKSATTLSELWLKFSEEFEKNIFPEPLQRTFLSLVENELNYKSFQFMDRSSVLMAADLNVSWSDLFAIKWAPVLNLIEKNYPHLVKAHPIVFQMSKVAQFPHEKNIIDYLQTKASLPSRISSLVSHLEKARETEEILPFLQEIGKNAGPGSPAIFRHLVAKKERLLSIAKELEFNDSNYLKKVINE